MMTKIISKSICLIFLVSLFLSGCATSQITSNKSPDFNEKLSKVYFVIKGAKGAKEFSYSFKTAFLKALAQKGITSDYYMVDHIALESEKEIKEKILKFQPQFLIVMTQVEVKTYAGFNWGNSNNISGGTFDVKILLPNSDIIVWRGSLEAYGDYGIDMAVEKSVKKLVEKLQNDNLI